MPSTQVDHRWQVGPPPRVRDTAASIARRLGTLLDAEDRSPGARESRLLADLGSILASARETDTLLRNVARTLVPLLGDWCVAEALDGDGPPRRLAVVPAADHLQVLATELLERPPGGILGTSTSAEETAFLVDCTNEALSTCAGDAEQMSAIRAMGARSAMVIPLLVGGKRAATLTLFRTIRSRRRYRPSDLTLATEIGRRVSLTFDTVHLLCRLQEISRMKDEFLADVCHELRTPSTAIVVWTHMMRTTDLGPERIQRALQVIEVNSRLQNRLIGQLLDVSRIVAGILTLQVETVDLAATVAAAVDSLRPAAEAKGVRLEVSGEPLPSIDGDPDRLLQVLGNLLSNALRHTPAGGGVRVDLAHRNDHVELSVVDDGPGIDPTLLPRVFDRFCQGTSATSRNHGGLGLGLSIVRELVTLHGGSTVAANHPDGGAVLTVRLPLRGGQAN